jgi:ribonucleoside-triphosphate reductase
MSELILTESFVSKYKNKQPNWGFNGLGYIVYKRTYARLKDNGKTEEWYETVQRCIEGAQKIGAQILFSIAGQQQCVSQRHFFSCLKI